jgi:glutaredoxin 3
MATPVVAFSYPDMSDITVYTTNWCGYCERAKALLKARGLEYSEVNLDDDPGFRGKLLDLTGRMTVPQIFIGDRPIGGFMELRELDRSGKLAALTASS